MCMLLYMYFMNMKEFEGTNWEELAAKSQVQDVQLWYWSDDVDNDGDDDNDCDDVIDDDIGGGGDDDIDNDGNDVDNASKMIIILCTYQSIALFQQARRLGGWWRQWPLHRSVKGADQEFFIIIIMHSDDDCVHHEDRIDEWW